MKSHLSSEKVKTGGMRMDLVIRFDNPDNVKYKMIFYKGPRSRGIGRLVFNGKIFVKGVKYGDVFCYKTYAEGYYTYKKAFIINEADIANGEKRVRLSFDKRKNNGYEADSVNYWTEEVETKLVSGQYEIEHEYELDTPAFSKGKAAHEFTTTDECIQYVENVCAGNENAGIFFLDERKKIPVVLLSKGIGNVKNDFQNAVSKIKETDHIRVMYQAQIHGNEPASGEAALNVIKQISQDEELLRKMDVIVIPHVNPYGAEKFVRFSDEHKRNLNRDSLMLESDTTRKLHEIYLGIMPEIFIDAHEFCGPFNDMFDKDDGNYLKMNDDIQVTCLNNLNRSQKIYMQEKEIVKHTLMKLEEQGFRCFCYRPACDYSTSCSYTRSMSSLIFFIETNGIGRGKIHFERRVVSQIETMKLLLYQVLEKAEEIKMEVACARTYRPEGFVLKHTVDEEDVMWISRLSYDFFGNVLGDKEKKMPYYNLSKAVKTMIYPKAYILDKSNKYSQAIKEILVQNGIVFSELPVNSEINVECYKEWFGKKNWTKAQKVKLRNGAYVFYTKQAAANVIIASLEPEVKDVTKGNGVARPVDLLIKNCKRYPVYRIM